MTNVFMFTILSTVLTHIIINEQVIINKAGFPEKQLYAERSKQVILKPVYNLVHEGNEGNIVTLIPIDNDAFIIRFNDERFLYLDKQNSNILVKRLENIQNTNSVKDGFEWKILETQEGIKFESNNKCLQNFSMGLNDQILRINGVECRNSKSQLFEIARANIAEKMPAFCFEEQTDNDEQKLPHINLIINSDDVSSF